MPPTTSKVLEIALIRGEWSLQPARILKSKLRTSVKKKYKRYKIGFWTELVQIC